MSQENDIKICLLFVWGLGSGFKPVITLSVCQIAIVSKFSSFAIICIHERHLTKLPIWVQARTLNRNEPSQHNKARQSKIFLNYIALYLIEVQKVEHVITCLDCAKIIKHFANLLHFYCTILSVMNSVYFQMRKRESSGYVLNCKLSQHEKSKVFWKL